MSLGDGRCPLPFSESLVLLFSRCFSRSPQLQFAGFCFWLSENPSCWPRVRKLRAGLQRIEAAAMDSSCPADGRYPDRRGKPCGVFPSPASRMPRNRPEMPLEAMQGGGVVVPNPPERNRDFLRPVGGDGGWCHLRFLVFVVTE